MKIMISRSLALACASIIVIASAPTAAQTLSREALVAALRRGGLVMVMRHASSPRDTPTKAAADPENTHLERQLDAVGRSSAAAMGEAVRVLKIPIGDVWSSPTYRALETIRLARLPAPRTFKELGDGGQSMSGASDVQGAWLRDKLRQPPSGANTLIVTHMPNITRAFPDAGSTADGEALIFRPDGQGGTALVGRITIDEWPALR